MKESRSQESEFKEKKMNHQDTKTQRNPLADGTTKARRHKVNQ